MDQKIQIRRGLKADLPTLDEGELAFCIDTSEVFVGTETGNTLVPFSKIIDPLSLLTADVLNAIDKSKAHMSHVHTLSDITDVNVENRADEDVLIYDSTLGKFMSKPLPTLHGGRDLLPFNPNDENVSLLLPYSVREPQVMNVTQTSIELKWKASKSIDIEDYTIYVNGSFKEATQNTSYILTNLDVATEYQITVKARNTHNFESPGYTVNYKTSGEYVLQLEGTGNYLEVPIGSYDHIEIIATFQPYNRSWSNHLLQTASGNYYLYSQHNPDIGYRSGGIATYINGVLAMNESYVPVPSDVKVSVRARPLRGKMSNEKLYLFANQNGDTTMKGIVYRVRLYKETDWGEPIIISDYDFTHVSDNRLVEDLLQNNPPLKIYGGVFVHQSL